MSEPREDVEALSSLEATLDWLKFIGRDHAYTRFLATECFVLEGRLEQAERALREQALWRATNVARARGLAQSIADLPDDFRVEGVRENGAEIAALLASTEGEER